MRRQELIVEIAGLKKIQAIKNAQLIHLEKTTNWQRELYMSTQNELFEVSENLDKKMDEYYYVAKTELINLDKELLKVQDSLMADPFNYNQLIINEKETKSKRLELWNEMKAVLWVEGTSTSAKAMVDKGGESFSVLTKRDGQRVVDWEVVKDAKRLKELETTSAPTSAKASVGEKASVVEGKEVTNG